MEGGDSDMERRCTFLELALALAGGLDAAGLETLYQAAKPGIQASNLQVAVKRVAVRGVALRACKLCAACPVCLVVHGCNPMTLLCRAWTCQAAAAGQ